MKPALGLELSYERPLATEPASTPLGGKARRRCNSRPGDKKGDHAAREGCPLDPTTAKVFSVDQVASRTEFDPEAWKTRNYGRSEHNS